MNARTPRPVLLHTRPISPQAQEFTQEAEALGAAALHVPLSVVQPGDEDQIRPDPNSYQCIVISSANALRFFAPRPADLEKPVYVVGPQTASAAQMAGFRHIALQAPDMRGLIAAIQGGGAPSCASMLYLRGRVVSIDLKAALAGVTEINDHITYRVDLQDCLPPALQEALRGGQIAGIAYFSRATATHFLDLCGRAGLLENIAITSPLTISEGVLECVRPFCQAKAYVAQTPDQSGLLEATRLWLADVQALR